MAEVQEIEAIEPVAATAVEPVAAAEPEAVEAPAAAKRGRKPKAAIEAAPVEAPAAKPAKVAKAAKPRLAVKRAKATPAPRKRPQIAPKAKRPARPVAAKAAPATAARAPAWISGFTAFKDTAMDMNPNFAEGFKTVIADAQEKAKAAFEKGTASFGEVNEFAKGNVEAMVESGKILTAGLQELGTSLATETRTAFESMSAEVKEFAAAKTPADLFKLQGEFVRRSFDSAVAHGSKNSEAMLKLMSEAFAPISGRINLAVEKARQTAL